MKKWLYTGLLSLVTIVITAFSVSADVSDNLRLEVENNNSLSYANTIYNDDTVVGVASGLNDLDYFKFKVTSRSDVVVVCAADHKTLKCILLNSAGEPLLIAEETTVDGVPLDSLGCTVTAGTYYLLLGNYDVSLENEYMFYFACLQSGTGSGSGTGTEQHQHSYSMYVTMPTCTKHGYTTNSCYCGDSYIDKYTDPLGHSFSYIDCDTPVTCARCGIAGESGHQYDADCDATCNRCDHVRTASPHPYEKTVTKATLTKNGKVVTQCADCGHIKSTTTVYRPYSVKLSATSYTYNGSVRTPTVTVKDYAGKTLVKDKDYTVTYASGRKNAGTYKVTVKFIGNRTGSKTESFTINPISISKCTVKMSSSSYKYNGKVQTPTVTVKNANGTILAKDTHYTVHRVTGCKNAGKQQVMVKMRGNYSGTKTLTYTIKPISISSCSVKFTETAQVYNGNSRTPTVVVKNANGSVLTKNTHYTVHRVTGCRDVGTHKVMIKMRGNYSGSKTLTFKINPPPTNITRVVLKPKNVQVQIQKKSSQVSGYQIQHSAYKSFKNATTVTVAGSSNTTPSVKVSGAKGTYHLRVRTYRTVDGVKYYSSWTTYEYTRL